MFEDKLMSIGKVSEQLGVSIDTLRRWEKTGKLVPMRTKGGQRRYFEDTIFPFLKDLFLQAEFWIASPFPKKPALEYYCQNRAEFEIKLHAFETELLKNPKLQNTFSFISSAVGEIGNNSFDHNLGNWKDVPGIFFGYDLENKKIVLADRGQGILKTLQKVCPNLTTHTKALYIAFTEIITGRAPEKRGNGLKYVRKIVETGAFKLVYQTGNAKLFIHANKKELLIKKIVKSIDGCIAFIEFS